MTSSDPLSAAARAAETLLPASSRVRTRPVWLVQGDDGDDTLADLTGPNRAWLNGTGWRPEAGRLAVFPDRDGAIAGAVLGLGTADDAPLAGLLAGDLATRLPAGDYHLANPPADTDLAHLAWMLGAYRFERYRPKTGDGRGNARRLKSAKGLDRERLTALASAVYLGRDLINTPANDLGPGELAAAAQRLAKAHDATCRVTVGERLLADNFPLIHAVGRASPREPRLIDLTWRGAAPRTRAPKVTIVGKGICFDTGGLNLKPGNSMLLMKKDMGGAAAALALASMIMAARLPVRLRVLIPAAENSVAGNAFRPGDILTARNGTTVEIGNTDAEGRLVLADALALADEEAPDYLFSLATLTGAARVALGPDLPPLYATDDDLANAILEASRRVADPLWRMPFWPPYDRLLTGKVGEVNHISETSFAGSLTAALFLKRFVAKAARYVHLDIYSWVPTKRPAMPRGGEPQGARAVFDTLRRRFG